MLHAYASCLPDAMALSARDCVLPVVPMFHANAWGLPFSAPLVGAKIVFPGCSLDGKSLHTLFEQEKVTFSAGVKPLENAGNLDCDPDGELQIERAFGGK